MPGTRRRCRPSATGSARADIDALLRKWLRILPHPFTADDIAAGYRYELSILQAEFSLTQVLDAPAAGRIFFEQVIRDNLDIGRPDQVALVFARRIIRKGRCATPGRFRTRVITDGVVPSLHIDYKHTKIKQYHKLGRALRTETTINDAPADFGIPKRLTSLPDLRQIGFTANRRLLGVQTISHDPIRGARAFTALTAPLITPAGTRIPGLRFGDPRVHALLQALLIHRLLPRGFTNRELRTLIAPLLGTTPEDITAGKMTYDLRRLREHGLIARIPHTRRYQVTDTGLHDALLFTHAHDHLLRPGLAQTADPSPPAPVPAARRRPRLPSRLRRPRPPGPPRRLTPPAATPAPDLPASQLTRKCRLRRLSPANEPWWLPRSLLEGRRGQARRRRQEAGPRLLEPVLDRPGIGSGQLTDRGRDGARAALPDPVEQLEVPVRLPRAQPAGQHELPGPADGLVGVVDLPREDGRDPRRDVLEPQRLRPGHYVRRALVARAGEHPGRDRGDVAGRHEPDPAAARGHADRRLVSDSVRGGQQVLHVQGRCEVGDWQANRLQMRGNLPVAEHEPHLAAGIREAVRRDLDHVRAVARGQQRVDEHRLQLGLLLDRRAERENPVVAAQDLSWRRVVEGRHHVLRRPRQVGGSGLDPHHGRDVGVRVGQRLHQVVSDPPGRSGHQYHAPHPIAPDSGGLGIPVSSDAEREEFLAGVHVGVLSPAVGRRAGRWPSRSGTATDPSRSVQGAHDSPTSS